MSAKIRERVSRPGETVKDSVIYMIQVESRNGHGWYAAKQSITSPATFKTEAEAERFAQNYDLTPVPPGCRYRIIKSRMVWEAC